MFMLCFSLGFLLLSISFDIYKCNFVNNYTYIFIYIYFFLILIKTDERIDKFRRGSRYEKEKKKFLGTREANMRVDVRKDVWKRVISRQHGTRLYNKCIRLKVHAWTNDIGR